MPASTPDHPIDRIAVVIPARDEVATIGGCLTAIASALAPVASSVACHVTVVDDGSVDATGRIARRALADLGARTMVLRADVGCVGTARRIGIDATTAGWCRPGRAWILSTDADSTVRPDWITRHLAHARRGVAAVSGVVDLFDDASAASFRSEWRSDYGRLIDPHHQGHPYAHATNLGVRLDAYRAVGGFRDLAREEDADLWRRLRRSGVEPLADARIVVDTSGRRTGRVPTGFAGALARLYPESRDSYHRRHRPHVASARPDAVAG